MSGENNKLPRLRFPEFRGAGDWEEKRLGEVANVNPKVSTLPKDFVYIDLESVVSGSLIKENNIKKAGAPSRAQRLLKKGDVLFQMVRPYQKNNYYFDKDGDYVASTGYAQLRAKGADKFLFQTLHTTSFINKVLARCTGTSYPAINSNDFTKIHFFIPTLPEQQKIAACLSSLDDLITAQAQKLDTLKTHKKGLMQQLFPAEGETVPKRRFPEFQGAGDWEEKRLGDVCAITTGRLDANAMVENGRYRFYTCAKNYYFIDEYAFDTDALLISGNGANVGYIHHYSGKFNAYQRTYVLDEFSGEIFYIQYHLEQNLYKRIATEKKDGNTPYIVKSTLAEMEITIPTLPEQQKIAACLTSLDDLIIAQAQKLDTLKTHKKGLMQQLFPTAKEAI